MKDAAIGRNDPCHCGSGKKYKKCCLAKLATTPDELRWRRLNELNDDVVRKLMAYGRDTFGGMDLIDGAWAAYTGWEDAGDPTDLDFQAFLPWMLYVFDPGAAMRGGRPAGVPRLTVVEAYLLRHGSRLSGLERRYMEAGLREPFRLWEIVSVEPGVSCDVEDFFTGTSLRVSERSATGFLQSGDVVWGHVITCDGISTFSGVGSVPIGPRDRIPLVDLRARIRRRRKALTEEVWRTDGDEVRLTYLGLRDQLMNPSLPVLQNTDGEALSPHTLHFDVRDPEAAFAAVKGLEALDGRPALSEPEVRRDAGGAFVSAEVVWHRAGNAKMKSWDNTILGHLSLTRTKLTAEVNSKERAARLRAELEKRLGASATWKRTVVTNVEKMLQSGRGRRDPKGDAEQEALMADPEVRAQVAAMLQKHYAGWVDERIPALGGKTPRQAVRSADGRAKVEALLESIERGPSGIPGFQPDVSEIRKTLGLL